MFLGYHGDPDATSAVVNEERWYRSGDFGRIEDGRLYLAGRRSDLILRGGENIYPAEIEDRLRAHPDVADVVVVGVPDRVLGEEVKAVVVRDPGPARRRRGTRVGRRGTRAVQGSGHVEFRDHLPRNATGKVMKHLLDRPRVCRSRRTEGDRRKVPAARAVDGCTVERCPGRDAGVWRQLECEAR